METKKTTPILPGIIYTQLKDTYTFKEITETEELEEAFRLRYEVYSKSKMCGFLKEKNSEMDIDTYDLHSKHFGLYTGLNELIGYFRVVLGRDEYYCHKAFEVGQVLGKFNEADHSLDAIKNQDTPEFPFLGYQNLPDSIKDYYHTINNSNEGVAECSRLVLKENYRGLRIAGFLIECAIVLCFVICNRQKHGVICCSKENIIYYMRYGFQAVGDGKSFESNGRINKIMSLSLNDIPSYITSKIDDKLKSYVTNNEIHLAI